jgi:hypothetical protein
MQIGSTEQMQMRKMDGSGGSNGEGMREMMQSLAPQDRTAVREQMASLSSADRQSFKTEMAKIDVASLSSEELSQTLFDLLSSFEEPKTDSGNLVDIYA